MYIYIYISLIVAICRRVEYRRIKRRKGEEELSPPRATPPLFFLFRRFHRRRSNGCLRVARGEQFPSETYCFLCERREDEITVYSSSKGVLMNCAARVVFFFAMDGR